MLRRDNLRRRGHQPAVKQAELSPALRVHDLRHTAATLWLAAGESIYFVQQQLGHRDIQTTIDLYGHPDRAAHREAAARAADVVARGGLGIVAGTKAGTTSGRRAGLEPALLGVERGSGAPGDRSALDRMHARASISCAAYGDEADVAQ